MSENDIYWHFVGPTLRDGRPVPPDGEWLVHEGEPEMCVTGLHASAHPFDALQYAPGSTLCEVRLAGKIEKADDKAVAQRRLIVRRVELEEPLRAFARQCALSVIDSWEAPDVIRRYLETGDPDLRSAAESAARSAARSAAWSTWSAAKSAAESAAWSAARSAAKSAAESAAESAAWSAARSAARSAAKSAARSAARSAQRDAFEAIVAKALPR